MARKRRRKMKKSLKLFLFILFVIGLCLVVNSFNQQNKNEEKKPVKKEEIKEEVKEPEKTLQILNVNSTTRPYAIMINNINVARPLQSGLQDAYIIYEIIVEGGITRYMALFMDKPTERIGSIRSARHYYLDYALENDAIYVHHGQSPQAQSDFYNLGVDRIVVDNSQTGWRDYSLNVSSEHTLFTNIEKLNTRLNNFRKERNKEILLDYSIDSLSLSTIEGVIPANKIVIPYSYYITTHYEYDSVNKVYKRFVNNASHTDYVTKKQYTFKNIITYKVQNYTLNDVENKGRQGINNIGKGEGYYISEGYAVPITWEKTSRISQTIYKLKDGTPLKVNDGNTFIQIQPTNQSLTIN